MKIRRKTGRTAAGRKKLRMFLPALTAVFLLFTGALAVHADEAAEGKQIRVLTTIFPLADWARCAAKDVPGVEVSFLQNTGSDLHSFQAGAADIMNIVSCDLFIYVGGESDQWVEDVLAGADNPDLTVLKLMDVLEEKDRLLCEETVEGMQEDHGEHEEHEDHEDHEDHEGSVYDEHIWLSLENARLCCEAAADALAQIDPDRADLYGKNAESYGEELAALDEDFREQLGTASRDTVLFADRFPFLYMMQDYGIHYYAAFNGCSAETEASFETVTFLIEKTNELGLSGILVLEGSDGKLADTIIANTDTKDQKVLVLNSMQTVTQKDADGGETYLSVMEEDLKVLLEAMS